jgi:methylenetetrahydrofolate dehydrogenase (NADP+)/methenyltetrahydrofolate cyclohydrolase
MDTSTTARVIDGKAIAAELRAALRTEIGAYLQDDHRQPGLAVVLVGNDPASGIYVRNKRKACQEVGIRADDYDLPDTTSEDELLELIEKLNSDPSVDGILVQLPLPKHIIANRILDSIDPDKDVDGFHPVNAGRLFLGEPGLVACTPLGIMQLLDRSGVELKGKRAVVVGRSNIVGKPMAMLLLQRHATVTICHSRTVDLPGVVREGDIVVAAVGRSEMVRGDWIKPGAVVIDVGMNRNAEGKLCGDVAYAEAAQVASQITPVPGGVGPMTIATLLRNTVQAYRFHEGH